MPEERTQAAALRFDCRRCRFSYPGPMGELRMVEAVLVELLSLPVGQTVNRAGVAPISLFEIHGCADGGRGIADVVGIEIGENLKRLKAGVLGADEEGRPEPGA